MALKVMVSAKLNVYRLMTYNSHLIVCRHDIEVGSLHHDHFGDIFFIVALEYGIQK